MTDTGHIHLLHDTPARILVFGGISLLVVNLLLGEVFAIFISHVANGEIRERWFDVVNAAAAGKDRSAHYYDRPAVELSLCAHH